MGHIYVKYSIKQQVGIPEKIITQEPGGQSGEGRYGINRSYISHRPYFIYFGEMCQRVVIHKKGENLKISPFPPLRNIEQFSTLLGRAFLALSTHNLME